jgi:muramoyltetrapeptide carboxypeptidase LdcA involved in peptidoglycan recycling
MGLCFTGALYTSFLPPSPMTKPRKPLALVPGSTIAVVAPASSAKEERIQRGCETLQSLDYRVKRYPAKSNAQGYF